jgi:CRP-like cAMP-binding protein
MSGPQNMRITVTGNCSTCAIQLASARGSQMCPLLPRQARAGEVIYREAEPAGFGWYVISGTVVLSRRALADARERGAGAFLGLETLVAETYLDTARALTEVTLCGGPREAFEGWLGNPAGAARIALDACLRAACADAGVSPDRASAPPAEDPHLR